MSGLVLEAVADDVEADGPLSALLPGRVRFGDFPGLRVLSAVHLLALERQAPMVALRLPTVGGVAPRSAGEREAFRAEVVSLLVAHPGELRASLARTPQTNEPGRAALLRCALSRLKPGSPVRLHEFGASAGLNLRADLLPGIDGLEAGPLPRIAERVGCDRDPVDVGTAAGRTLLSSYVWVDDVHRFERLGRALDVAQSEPVGLVRQDAAEFCSRIVLAPGTTTVIWHSAVWVYLDDGTRSRVLGHIGRLGASATEDSALAHISWEWPAAHDDPAAPFALVMRRWCGDAADGAPRLIARGTSHGSSAHLVQDGRSWPAEDPLLA